MLKKKKIVCPQCEGTGKHVNPAVDGNGLSAEDFEDEDFKEGYFSDRYDIRCILCKGENVIDEVIPEPGNPEYEEYLEGVESDLFTDAIYAAEQAMGA